MVPRGATLLAFSSWSRRLQHHGRHLSEELALPCRRSSLNRCPAARLCQWWRRLWWRPQPVGGRRDKKVIARKHNMAAWREHRRGLKAAVCHSRCGLVRLEQPEDDCPCVLTLSCSSSPLTSIRRLLVISQARTMEVYSQEGDYCGTARGERDDSIQTDRWILTMWQYAVLDNSVSPLQSKPNSKNQVFQGVWAIHNSDQNLVKLRILYKSIPLGAETCGA